MSNDYSMKDVYKTVGEEGSLREAVDNFKKSMFSDNEEEFVKWWYDPNNQGLGNKSPEEICQKGEKERKYLENILTDMFYGSHGG